MLISCFISLIICWCVSWIVLIYCKRRVRNYFMLKVGSLDLMNIVFFAYCHIFTIKAWEWSGLLFRIRWNIAEITFLHKWLKSQKCSCTGASVHRLWQLLAIIKIPGPWRRRGLGTWGTIPPDCHDTCNTLHGKVFRFFLEASFAFLHHHLAIFGFWSNSFELVMMLRFISSSLGMGQNFFSEKNKGGGDFFQVKKWGATTFSRQFFPKTRPFNWAWLVLGYFPKCRPKWCWCFLWHKSCYIVLNNCWAESTISSNLFEMMTRLKNNLKDLNLLKVSITSIIKN